MNDKSNEHHTSHGMAKPTKPSQHKEATPIAAGVPEEDLPYAKSDPVQAPRETLRLAANREGRKPAKRP